MARRHPPAHVRDVPAQDRARWAKAGVDPGSAAGGWGLRGAEIDSVCNNQLLNTIIFHGQTRRPQAQTRPPASGKDSLYFRQDSRSVVA